MKESKKSILITDKVHSLLVDGLTKNGFEVLYRPELPYKEVRRLVSQYDGLIINSKVICNKDFLNEFEHLEFIGRLGSGLDIIDLPYAGEKNISILSSPEGNANAVGEHALGMLLTLLHNIHRGHNDVCSFNWNREVNRGEELSGKTIGILGYGHTGPAFANKLSGLNTKVLIYDKYKKNIITSENMKVVAELDDLISNVDILSIHLPLTSETQNMIDAEFIDRLKRGVIIINTSRGKVLDSKALLNGLMKGHVGGACLDVLENEKPDSWSTEERKLYEGLFQCNNVVITPHIAGWTHQSLQNIAQILLDRIVAHYQR